MFAVTFFYSIQHNIKMLFSTHDNDEILIMPSPNIQSNVVTDDNREMITFHFSFSE